MLGDGWPEAETGGAAAGDEEALAPARATCNEIGMSWLTSRELSAAFDCEWSASLV